MSNGVNGCAVRLDAGRLRLGWRTTQASAGRGTGPESASLPDPGLAWPGLLSDMDGPGLNGVPLTHGVAEEEAGAEESHGPLKHRSPAGGDYAAVVAAAAGGKAPADGRHVNKAAPRDGSPGSAVSAAACLPCRLEDSCVISAACGDDDDDDDEEHGGMNGFSTAGDWAGVGWTGGGGHAAWGEEDEEEGDSGALFAPGGGSETSPGLRRGCGGVNCREVPDSDDLILAGGQRAEEGIAVSDRLPQMNCTCALVPDLNSTLNGGLSAPGLGDLEADTTCGEHTGLEEESCRGEVKVANGGFHIVCSPRDLPELPGDDSATGPEEPEPAERGQPSPPPLSQGEQGGGLDLPQPPSPSVQDSTSPGSPGLPLPATPPDSTGMRPPSPAGSSPPSPGLSVAARPQSLRTQGGSIPVSLSCDATPLSPDDGGGLYLEIGRRQSAPDPSEHCDPHNTASTSTSPPKRFALAEFFTRRKQLEFEPQSTTALILEDRPGNLPAKCEEEAQRHKQDVRGRVWSLAIGNDLNITPELYDIFLCRVKDRWRCSSETSSVNDSESDGGASLADRESSLDLIKLDISRTFPSLFIFQKGGPYHDVLHSLLGAYTCYRPDIGYVQGMSFIAAVLILNLEEAEAFITFANLLNKPCQMAFFRVDHDLMLKYFAAFEVFFEENMPRLFRHFLANSLTPDLYLIDWIFTLYSKALPLDVACRVWDVFCRDGEESLFRAALGLLRLYQDVLLQMDFIHMAQFLTRLPADLAPHLLFSSMANTHMVSRAGRWAQDVIEVLKKMLQESQGLSPGCGPGEAAHTGGQDRRTPG
ncbi:hypothetical protein CRUP_026843, partial [Coryphaenoides rupestris]